MPSIATPSLLGTKPTPSAHILASDVEKAESYQPLDGSSDRTGERGSNETSNPTPPNEKQPDNARRNRLIQRKEPSFIDQTTKSRWKHLTERKDPPPIDPNADRRRKLSWQKLTVCLIVEAIALGTLGMPAAFASMGMALGISVSFALGLLAIYTALVISEVIRRFPAVQHYADAVGLVFGRLGYELASVMFIALLVLLLGSHILTGTTAFNRIVDDATICRVSFSVASAVLLFLLALPPSFTEFAILGYIDFGSIIIAVSTVTIASGINAPSTTGLHAVDWTWGPPADMTFQTFMLGATNIIFAYTFAVAMPTFMSEMCEPSSAPKAVWTLGGVQTTIYTLTGALNYAFIGSSVEPPVLLSAQPFVVSRVAFGLALPVIYISGSINSNVVGAYIFDRWLPGLREGRGRKFWICWTALLAAITTVSWVIASAIPFFNALLGLISSLFASGFTFYFPALFWFLLLKEGKWNRSGKNVALAALNTFVLAIGVVLLVCGTYVSIWEILREYRNETVIMPFSCRSRAYKEEVAASGVEYSRL